MISRNNSIPSILLFTAIASSILTPFTTARSHRAIASLETSNSIELRDRNAIAINTDKRLFDKFKVNGIGLGASKSSIIRTFGKPIKIETFNNTNNSPCLRGYKYQALYYRGAEFHLLNENLAIANFTTSKYKTESGIRVGNPISSVKAKYAKYGRSYKSSGNRIDIKPLNFWYKNGLINQISLAEFDDLC